MSLEKPYKSNLFFDLINSIYYHTNINSHNFSQNDKTLHKVYAKIPKGFPATYFCLMYFNRVLVINI